MSLNFLTPSDLESAMKKLLEDMHVENEKSQAKLLDKIKKAMRAEFRHQAAVSGTPATPTRVTNSSVMPAEVMVSNMVSNARKSIALPFKSTNAKLNDADDLNTHERRSNVQLEKQITPREDRPMSQDDDEKEKSDSAAKNDTSVRGLLVAAMEERPAESKKVSVISPHEDALLQESTAGTTNPLIEQPTDPLLVQPDARGESKGQTQTTQMNLVAILQNPILEGSIVCLVILNAVWVGVELEYRSSVSEVRPMIFDWVDGLFCVLFSAELIFRISALGADFFKGSQSAWNYLDLILVPSQIMEIVLRWVEVEAVNKKNVNVSWLRILRILRIVRLTRIVRAVRFLEGLRTLMKCLVRGMADTGWITLFLLMQIYTCSLAFTELLRWIRGSFKTGQENGAELDLMFGSLSSTMLTLCKSITGGIVWENAMAPLMEVSQSLGLAFMMYVSFSLLVILNIFTGFFVNTSSMCADEDNKTMLRDRVADIFVDDENANYLSNVNETAFTERVSSPEMQSYFNQIDLHVDEAEGLFKILDLDGQGTLDPIQIVSGLMRMRGTAKALDLRVLTYLVTRAQEKNTEHMLALAEDLARVHDSIASLQEQHGEQKGGTADGQQQGG